MQEAALDPSLWNSVLQAWQETFHASAVVFASGSRAETYQVFHSAGLDESDINLQNKHYSKIDPYVAEVGRRKLTQSDNYSPSHGLVPDSVLEKTEIYQDFMRPRGHHYGFGCSLLPGTAAASMLGIQRPKRFGPIEGADERAAQFLIPHLRAAVRTHAQLACVEAERDTSFFAHDALGRAVFLLDRSGRVLRMNRSAERIANSRDGLTVGADGLRAATTTQTAELRREILIAANEEAGELRSTGATLRLPRPSQKRPYAVSIAPLARGRAVWRFGQPIPAVAVTTIDLDETPLPDHSVFQRLLELTPSESRLAAHLCQGKSIEDAVDALSISRNTARTHLQHIFQKTGTRKQGELVAFLNRLVLLRK